MFKWRKVGRVFNPLEVHGISWLKEFAQAPATLVFDDYLRVFFACRPNRDENGQYVSHTAFVDLDRANLMKVLRFSKRPVLELGAPGTFDEFGTYPTSVIRDGSQLIAYYGGWTRCSSVAFTVAIGKAISRDNGESFQKVGKGGPILSFSPDEPFIISGPKIRRYNHKWFLFYIAGKRWVMDAGNLEPVYRIRLATSDNGEDWVKENRDLIECTLGENEAQASPDVIYHHGKYHMFFCYRHGTDYRGNRRGYRIGYAHSTNLFDWTRDDPRAGINLSENNGFDNESMAYPHVFDLDGNLKMFYLGNEVGRFGFGLATLENYTDF